ncbi:DUF3262 family protein [Gilliamella sp. Nev3-1]|uniref:DUF3262 family protein n=1 Tax=Gilliamella sp. Nev3-1 TaxID=3120250 RepID=UPI00080E1740|nr:DUF3262 family protein [Gilliamella apicola]OCG57903.1 hypothetical protein A9G40_11715 [Gilliamella apicola]
MNDIKEKTYKAFKDAATFTMDDSFNFFGAVCFAVGLFLIAIIILCLLKGLGDESVKIDDFPPIIIRAVVLVLILMSFIYFQ